MIVHPGATCPKCRNWNPAAPREFPSAYAKMRCIHCHLWSDVTDWMIATVTRKDAKEENVQ